MILGVTCILCLEIILRARADLNCSQYIDKFDTEYLPGTMGKSFLILTEAHYTYIFWESYCLHEQFPKYGVKSPSKGLQIRTGETRTGEDNSILIINDGDQILGTVILTFSEKVKLFYPQADFSQLLWTPFVLPTNRLGTEYFIVFPDVDVVEYGCVICSIHNNTDVMVVITQVGNVIAEQTLITHLGQHDHSVIRQVFDFSGSRILSMHNVAVFCFIDTDIQIEAPYAIHQLLPTNVFGSHYYIDENVHIVSNAMYQSSLRLVAISANTSVTVSNFPDVDMEVRGQITDLDVNLKGIIKLISNKSFILFSVSSSYKMFITPVEQYAKYVLFGFTESFIKKIEIYYITVARESPTFNVDYSHSSKWKPVSVQYDLQMIHNYSDVSVGLMTTTQPLESQINLYIISSLLIGGRISFYTDQKQLSWQIGAVLRVIFKSCRLVEITECYEGPCNSTFVDSCELKNTTHNKHTEEKEEVNHISTVIVTVVVVAAVAVSLLLLSAAGRYAYIRSKRRIRPNLSESSSK